MDNDFVAKIERLEDALAETRRALRIAHDLFSDIRGDWSDPRWQCRHGWEVIDAALAKSADLVDDLPIPVEGEDFE